MPLPVAWADGAGTEMINFRPSTPQSSKPQAWMTQQPVPTTVAPISDIAADGEWMVRTPLTAPGATITSAVITAMPRSPPPYFHPPAVLVSAPTTIATAACGASSAPRAVTVTATDAASTSTLTPRSSTRTVSFRQPLSHRSRRPSANLSATNVINLDTTRATQQQQQQQPTAASSQQLPTALAASSSSSSSYSASLASSSAYCDTLDGYTVIDIRSLPPSLTSSPAHSAASSPAPPRRVKTLHVDTQQLMQAAQEEDVSPRTALFLAMKQKAKADKKKAKKAKEKSDRDKDKDQPRPSSGAVAASSRQPPQPSQQQGTAVSKRHTLQPHSSNSSSLSSSLHSLSLSPELSSLSASLSRSPRSSLSRGSLDEDRRDERRLKKDERRRLGYKLCKVSGCMEARGRDEDGQHYKYCRAHLGIHTQNNPNSRKKTQRDIT